MLIENIILRNFRVYKGEHKLPLSTNPEKHVTIISGQNGFGKTSLLTALVWGLYGKLMADVDERYRKEIYESGGYKKYAGKLINRSLISDAAEIETHLKSKLAITSNVVEKEQIKSQISDLYSFSVSIELTDIFIPHLSCKQVTVKRTYNYQTGNEIVEILIDGNINELTKAIGSEIFINDFILPKEIAKFFFFDAEKITAFAEVKSLEEKQYFSKAYNEVLGIKKYTDLKTNLENLQLRVRKKSASKADFKKLEGFQAKIDENDILLEFYNSSLLKKEQEVLTKKGDFSEIQERLIRAGSSMSFEEIQEFKKVRAKLKEEIVINKNKFNDMLELAPFAMLSSQIFQIKKQLEVEERQQNSALVKNLLREKYQELKNAFLNIQGFDLLQVDTVLKDVLISHDDLNDKSILDFTKEQHNNFLAIYDNLHNSYSKHLKNLISDSKRLQSTYNITQRKIQDAESKADDPVIKTLKESYESLLLDIKILEESVLDIRVKIGITDKENIALKRQLSEQSKHISVEVADKNKEESAARLINHLTKFIYQLKQKKKVSLEKNIKKELNRLMHKSDFVENVEVKIEGDLIDIELYDYTQSLILKDSLSKGEQQLYATALLKALITESNIQFPVFIDSPLQKLDKMHSSNIIKDFYPSVSSQVVIFPLLEKELNADEYELLIPKIGKAFLIGQKTTNQSSFNDIYPEDLFSQYHKMSQVHVY